MNTETTEEEASIEERILRLAYERRDHILQAKLESRRGSNEETILKEKSDAQKSWSDLVTLASEQLQELPQERREDALGIMCQIVDYGSRDGLTSVGFDPDKFKENVNDAFKAAEQREKEPSPV